jgi:uncharacterized protein YprB with RNaseH-like and TPR domain
MSAYSLHDRLQRLKRPSSADDPAPTPLDRLERELLGGVEAPEGELSLKARLERLVGAATLKEKERRRAPEAVPLEELVDGMRVENERGEFFLVDSSVHLELRHGDVPLSRVHAIDGATVGVLSGEEALEAFDLRQAVFLDTETTGLAGGAGTAAFLIGLGWFAGERFHVRQYFMRDYHEEAALLHALAAELGRFDRLVTFNGKMFDLPLLDARFRLNRARFPLSGAPHLDLLHPARRLWKARLESCRQQSLEAGLLGLERSGDIPGAEIPQVYFDWVRRRDARMLARVFEHNRQDIVSLAALAVLACQWVEEGRAEDARDVYSLARVLERARQFERSEAEYRRALALDAGALRGAVLLRLAWRAKRAGEHERAAALWKEAAAAGEVEAWRELAMHHEHRSRDFEQALAAVAGGLALVEPLRRLDVRARHLAEGCERRRARLLRKASRSRAAGSRRAPGSAPAS